MSSKLNQLMIRNEYYRLAASIENTNSLNNSNDLVKVNKSTLLKSNIYDSINHLKKIQIPLVDSNKSHEIWWLDELNSLFEEGKKKGIISNIIVHGSYGDYSYTNFSDLDITLVLEEEIFRNININTLSRKWILGKIYPFLYRVDPLQHHGPFYLWPGLIKKYSESILPLDVYKCSWGLKEEVIGFNTINRYNNDSRLSQTTCQSLLNHKISFFSHGYSMYAVKRYLSNLMILPAFYFTDTHCPMHKKESFFLFKNKYKNSQEIIDISTHLRNIWPETPAALGLLRLCLFKLGRKGKSNVILQKVYQNKSINKIVKEDLIPKVDEFCHSFLKSLA